MTKRPHRPGSSDREAKAGSARPLRARAWWLALALALPAPTWAGERAAVHVDGLACPLCAYGIEKHLLQLDAVEDTALDLEGGRVVIELREGARLDPDALRAAVRRAGFTLNRVEMLPPTREPAD